MLQWEQLKRKTHTGGARSVFVAVLMLLIVEEEVMQWDKAGIAA